MPAHTRSTAHIFQKLRPGPLQIPQNAASDLDDSPSGASLSDVSAGLISPEGQVEAQQSVQVEVTLGPELAHQEAEPSRNVSDGSVSVPFYNDIPACTIAESSADAPRLAMALSTASTEFGLRLVERILHDEAGPSSATPSQMRDMLKRKLDIIESLTQITRLDTMEGIERTIAQLQTLSRHREVSQDAYEATAQGTPRQSATFGLDRPANRPGHARDRTQPIAVPRRVLPEQFASPISGLAHAPAPTRLSQSPSPSTPTPVPISASGTLLVDDIPHRERAPTPVAGPPLSENLPATRYADDTEQPMVFMMSGLGTPTSRSPERPANNNTNTVTRSNIVTQLVPALVATAARRNLAYDAGYVNGAPIHAQGGVAVARAPRGREYWEALGRQPSNAEAQGAELDQLRARQNSMISTLTQAIRGVAPPTEEHPAYRTTNTR